MTDALERLISALIEALGFELFDLRLVGSRSRPTVQIRIDRLDGGTVTVDDCAVVSRAVEARLDEDGSLGERYVLEVSSPGLERRLRNAADWQRFVGRKASVSSPALNGREEVEIVAINGEPGAEVVLVRDERGQEQRVALADVKDARLAFHW
ncbi:MAG TPA: ribosome maturation factor RimP [Gemmatimonadaceae bacterium]|nr:ribosome maturation factor RimP [Gemmatimonadaceae bacterium]